MDKPVKEVELLAADLTTSGEIFCPHPKAQMELWNTHPRVYMDIAHADGHRAKCLYCGTVYRLKEGEPLPAGH